jgi:hypothetical protein
MGPRSEGIFGESSGQSGCQQKVNAKIGKTGVTRLILNFIGGNSLSLPMCSILRPRANHCLAILLNERTIIDIRRLQNGTLCFSEFIRPLWEGGIIITARIVEILWRIAN